MLIRKAGRFLTVLIVCLLVACGSKASPDSNPASAQQSSCYIIANCLPGTQLLLATNRGIEKRETLGLGTMFGVAQRSIAFAANTRDGFRFTIYDAENGVFGPSIVRKGDMISKPIQRIGSWIGVDSEGRHLYYMALRQTADGRVGAVLNDLAIESGTVDQVPLEYSWTSARVTNLADRIAVFDPAEEALALYDRATKQLQLLVPGRGRDEQDRTDASWFTWVPEVGIVRVSRAGALEVALNVDCKRPERAIVHQTNAFTVAAYGVRRGGQGVIVCGISDDGGDSIRRVVIRDPQSGTKLVSCELARPASTFQVSPDCARLFVVERETRALVTVVPETGQSEKVTDMPADWDGGVCAIVCRLEPQNR